MTNPLDNIVCTPVDEKLLKGNAKKAWEYITAHKKPAQPSLIRAMAQDMIGRVLRGDVVYLSIEGKLHKLWVPNE